MKNVLLSAKQILLYAFVGLMFSQCSKNSQPNYHSTPISSLASKAYFNDAEIEKIAVLHNEYLAEMINWGVHDKTSLVDYLWENFEDFKSISKDSLMNIVYEMQNFKKEDLNNLILQNSDKFNNANALVDFLDQADIYLNNFDETVLRQIENQARQQLSGIDWQVFYAYISVMKKSKEFWVDLDYLNTINSQAQARDVVKADAVATASALLVALGLVVAGGLGCAFCFVLAAEVADNIILYVALESVSAAF